MRKPLFWIVLISPYLSFAQLSDSSKTQLKNSAQTLIDSKDGNLLLAAYGEVHFNQPMAEKTSYNGSLDVHRQVLLFGYKFDNKTSFITEIEIEHIKEVYLEQAFLNYKAKPWLNIQAGLLLIPIGIINEYHEPTTFNGVERPLINSTIIPTTWREIGAGVAGNITSIGLRYQLYAVNGPLGFDNEAKLNGEKPIRGARQKGSQVTMTGIDVSGRLTYYGVRGLNLALSGYWGKTESSLYHNLHDDSLSMKSRADSSSVGVRMISGDFRFQKKNFEARGELILMNLSNTSQYNAFTNQDLGKTAYGYYAEVGYNIGKLIHAKNKVVPFFRYSNYDTHQQTSASLIANPNYKNWAYTSGISWFINPNFVVKGDYQHFINGNNNTLNMINLGVGYWFR
ncbi:porin family protein [Bacteroidia bacterium]|nr:porin family protein [Bacteroidia bacterium]